MTAAKKRKLTRYHCRLPASFRTEQDPKPQLAEVLDISPGGARVRCAVAVVHIGDTIEIAIRSERPFVVLAKVAFAESLEFVIDEEGGDLTQVNWADTATGVFGVQFLKVGLEEKKRLEALLRSLTPAQAA